MHDRVDPPVEQPVLGLEACDPEWTRGVVLSATPIRLGETTKVGIFASRVALAAPFGTRDSQQVGYVAFAPKLRVCFSLGFVDYCAALR